MVKFRQISERIQVKKLFPKETEQQINNQVYATVSEIIFDFD